MRGNSNIDLNVHTKDDPRSFDSGDGRLTWLLDSGSEENVKHSVSDLEFMITDEAIYDLAATAKSPPPDPVEPVPTAAHVPRDVMHVNTISRRERPQQGSAFERRARLVQEAERRRVKHRAEAVRGRRTLPRTREIDQPAMQEDS